MQELWMGIDVGTGGTRALLVNEAGTVVAAESAAHQDIAMPQPLWAQQDAEDWWGAAQRAIRAARRAAGDHALRGIGLTGQMHGVVLLDINDRVLGPSLIWCDQRTQPQVDELTQQIGAQRIIELTGNPMLTGFSAPKLLWERRHRAAEFTQARHFLLPKDYIRLKLTGEFATDVADASGTGLFDVGGRNWSKPMLDALGLPAAFVPRAYEGPEITGSVSGLGAEATGLPMGIPVVAGGGDQAAGAVGNGIVRAGIASATIGTSGVVFAATDQPLVDRQGRIHTFCHSVPGMWHVMGVTQGAGLSLRWVRDQLGTVENEAAGKRHADPYELLCELAATIAAGSDGLLFLPYLMGERTPHLDALARGGWIGLTASHTRAHLVRSVLEGVAYSLRDSFEIFRELGLRSSEVRLSGGGARGRTWPRIQTDVYGVQCARMTSLEGAAYGAALLAMVGSGRFPSVVAACDHCLREADRMMPDAAAAAVYNRDYAVYRELYPRLQTLFPQMC